MWSGLPIVDAPYRLTWADPLLDDIDFCLSRGKVLWCQSLACFLKCRGTMDSCEGVLDADMLGKTLCKFGRDWPHWEPFRASHIAHSREVVCIEISIYQWHFPVSQETSSFCVTRILRWLFRSRYGFLCLANIHQRNKWRQILQPLKAVSLDRENLGIFGVPYNGVF